jgi:hypothetical protein
VISVTGPGQLSFIFTRKYKTSGSGCHYGVLGQALVLQLKTEVIVARSASDTSRADSQGAILFAAGSEPNARNIRAWIRMLPRRGMFQSKRQVVIEPATRTYWAVLTSQNTSDSYSGPDWIFAHRWDRLERKHAPSFAESILATRRTCIPHC